ALALTTASTCAPGARSRALARFARSAERLTCAISGRDMEAAGTRARLEMDPVRAVWSGAIKRGIRREPHAPATFIIIHIYAQRTPPATCGWAVESRRAR